MSESMNKLRASMETPIPKRLLVPLWSLRFSFNKNTIGHLIKFFGCIWKPKRQIAHLHYFIENWQVTVIFCVIFDFYAIKGSLTLSWLQIEKSNIVLASHTCHYYLIVVSCPTKHLHQVFQQFINASVIILWKFM